MTQLSSLGWLGSCLGTRRGVALLCLLPFLAWVGAGCITDLIRTRGIEREYQASYEECRLAIEAAIASKTPVDGTRIRLQHHRQQNGWISAERSIGRVFIVEFALHDGFLLEGRSAEITSIKIYSTRTDKIGRSPLSDYERANDWHAALATRLSPVK
jgi:hypothetical protein